MWNCEPDLRLAFWWMKALPMLNHFPLQRKVAYEYGYPCNGEYHLIMHNLVGLVKSLKVMLVFPLGDPLPLEQCIKNKQTKNNNDPTPQHIKLTKDFLYQKKLTKKDSNDVIQSQCHISIKSHFHSISSATCQAYHCILFSLCDGWCSFPSNNPREDHIVWILSMM